MQVLGDAEPHIQADDVGQPQRADRMLVAEHHRRVDVLGGGDALLDHPDRLEAERDAQAGAGEARRVGDDDRRLAEGFHPAGGQVDEFGVAAGAHDDFHQAGGGHRVEEVHAARAAPGASASRRAPSPTATRYWWRATPHPPAAPRRGRGRSAFMREFLRDRLDDKFGVGEGGVIGDHVDPCGERIEGLGRVPRSMLACSAARTCSRAASALGSSRSTMVTVEPDTQNACAIPEPILPPPRTPTWLGGGGVPPIDSSLSPLQECRHPGRLLRRIRTVPPGRFRRPADAASAAPRARTW